MTTFTPSHIIDIWSKTMKKSSIDTMDGQMKRIFKILKTKTYNIEKIENAKEIWKIIKTNVEAPSSRKNLILVCMNAMKAEGKDITQYEKIFKRAIKENKYANESKIETHEPSFNWQTVLDKYEKAKKDFNETRANVMSDKYHNICLRYVILSCYVLNVPLRGGDWFLACMTNGTEEENKKLFDEGLNAYNMATGELILNTHKTVAKKGTRIVKISPELDEILRGFVLFTYNKGINDKKALWILSKGKMLDKLNICYILNTIFSPLKISTSALRKLYVSAKVGSMTVPNQIRLAEKMGHGRATQQFIYKRYQGIEDGEKIEISDSESY